MSLSSFAMSCGKMLGSGALNAVGGIIVSMVAPIMISKVCEIIKERKNCKKTTQEEDPYLF